LVGLDLKFHQQAKQVKWLDDVEVLDRAQAAVGDLQLPPGPLEALADRLQIFGDLGRQLGLAERGLESLEVLLGGEQRRIDPRLLAIVRATARVERPT